MQKKIISASILSADFANLGKQTQAVLDAGVDYIHFDVMDHHFVPNLSFGSVVCKALRNAGISAPIDVHLMVKEPLYFIEPFAKAGANLITFHPETVKDVKGALKQIREAGMKSGLAFNPDVSVNLSDEILAELDMILLMSVMPGFGGQSFIETIFDKIQQTCEQLNRSNHDIYLGVDGGIKVENIGKVAKAGANFFVVGSGLFHAKDYHQRVHALRNEINK